ncbi:hypothetical protein HDU92_005415 [Lobulomyces angularis]|nr:hypothetical protein HDU92_005415 [Lobulomyces angularis]
MPLPKRIISNKLNIRTLDFDQSPEVAQRKCAIAQIELITFQLAQLSAFSNEIFEDLMISASKVSNRIKKIKKRIHNIKETDLPNLNEIIEHQSKISLEKNFDWKLKPQMPCNFFTKETENVSIQKVYETCDSAPNLGSLDKFRNDQKSSLNFYTYPGFFVEEWKNIQQKENEERKQKRKAKKVLRQRQRAENVAELVVKKYNSHGEVILPGTPEVKKIKNSIPGSSPPPPPGIQGNISSTKNQPPPPPPPPGLPAFSSSAPNQGSSSNKSIEVSQKAEVSDARSGLMSDIKLGIKLKKVEEPVIKKVQQVPQNDVAAILMRRVALEMSDSESDGSDESDGDEWE